MLRSWDSTGGPPRRRANLSDDGFLDSIVSDEEIKALLRDEDGDQAEPETVPALRSELPTGQLAVVLASRRSDDADFLLERLKARSVRVDVARNAFRALDLLRARSYVAVLSDLNLWADGGRLLFDRLSGMAEPPLVVFLTEKVARSEQTALKAGVAGELSCPLSLRDVEVAVEQLLAVVRPATAAVDGPLSTAETVPAGAPLLGGRREPWPSASRGEMPWLRFFLEGQRLLRSCGERCAFLSGLVRLACETLGAEAAAIKVEINGQSRALLSVASRDRKLSEIAAVLESQIPSECAEAVFSLQVDGASGSPQGEPGEGACRIVLVGLPRHVLYVAPTFREDLRYLIARANETTHDA